MNVVGKNGETTLMERVATGLSKLGIKNKATVAVCPSFLGLASINTSKIKSLLIGAQDCFWKNQGAFTGEISPKTLSQLGCSFVVLGHSERRMYLGETDEMVSKKLAAVCDLGSKLTPVVCVGETLSERKDGRTIEVVRSQLKTIFSGVSIGKNQTIVVAYEPVWAIGSGKACTPGDCADVRTEIMALFALWYPEHVRSGNILFIYGGSVTQVNVRDFVSPDISNGVLVGGASLKTREFLAIVRSIL